MLRRSTLIMTFASAMFFNWTAWSQTAITNGFAETSLKVPGSTWVQHPFTVYNSTSGVYLWYWGCGGSSPTDGICVGQMTPTGAVSNVAQVVFANSSVCDIQDPGVVVYGGTYYLYAAGVRCGGPTTNNEHAAIYGWQSSDGHTFTALNSGNPIIQFAVDTSNGIANAGGTPSPCLTCYTGHGINAPTPVVMAECSCIRVYYWYQAPGYGLISNGNGIEAQDSTDGTNFSNERVILSYGFAQQVKKTGLYGDYPLVMTFSIGGMVGGNAAFVTAVSSGFSDQYWTCEYSCGYFSANSNDSYPPHLVSDLTGLLLDTNRNTISVSGLNSGEGVFLHWDNGIVNSPNSWLYAGSTGGSNLFPDLVNDPVAWPVEFIPSSYPTNTGVTETFYIQGEDYAGGSAIAYLQPMFSPSSDMSSLTNSCHLLYSSSNNTLYLDSSAGDFNWVGSQVSGGSWSGSNSNTACQVNSWSTSTSGNYLTVTANVTFLQNLTWWEYASATNATGSSPWLTSGLTWTY